MNANLPAWFEIPFINPDVTTTASSSLRGD